MEAHRKNPRIHEVYGDLCIRKANDVRMQKKRQNEYFHRSVYKIKFEIVHGNGIAVLDAVFAHPVYDAVFTHHALKIGE